MVPTVVGEQSQGSQGRGKSVRGRKGGVGGPKCLAAHLAPVMPRLGLIWSWCRGAVTATLDAMLATQLLKDPPQLHTHTPPPRRGGEEEEEKEVLLPHPLTWARKGVGVGCSECALSQFPHPVPGWGDPAPPSPLPCIRRGTHTRVPRGVGACLRVTVHHMPGVRLLWWLGGQGTVSRRVGREGWLGGSRGKARGAGARRKQACVAQAREHIRMHSQLLGESTQPGRLCGAWCSCHPQVGGHPLPPKMGCSVLSQVKLHPQKWVTPS